MEQRIVSTNRKAFHLYNILDKYETGIELMGSEVKSLREGSANLKESYVFLKKNQLWASGIHINPYSHTGFDGHEPTRLRKLLLNRKEIEKIRIALDQKGLTAVPLKIYFNDRGWAKLEIGIAKGKKIYEKKDAKKERDIKRQTERELRLR